VKKGYRRTVFKEFLNFNTERCMLLTMILAVAIGQPGQVGQAPPAPKVEQAAKTEAAPSKQWFNLTNMSGWQGFGALNANGWVVTEKFRRIGTTEEVPIAKPGEATQQPTVATAAVEATDPYGFGAWLNATRSQYGLPPVGHDPNLSGWAAENNNHQAARGMGHFVMGPARRQNAAMGSFGNIGSMWMNSRGHRAALLDPTIRWFGLAGLGAYWTFNAY
jgi:hypothetical protein